MKLRTTIKAKVAIAAFFAGSIIHAQNNEEAVIAQYLASRKVGFENTFKIIHKDSKKDSDKKIVTIQQTFGGVPVYGAISSVLMNKEGVQYLSDKFITVPESTGGAKTRFDVEKDFNSVLSSAKLRGDKSDYDFKGRLNNSVIYQLVYFPDDNGQLKLSYAVNFFEKGTNNYWDIIVDAVDGSIIKKTNLTVSCQFHDHAFTGEKQSGIDHYQSDASAIPVEKNQKADIEDNASYRVYAFPVESPNFGPRTLETNPWYLDASPLGWHNDGDTTYNFTRGNNAYAYTDLNGSNQIGASANGGTQRLFDFPLNLSQPVTAYTNASITNLFYASNKMHDIFYRYGFDEAGRNFQSANFGKGEPYTDYDPVLAEARDGSGFNNANFATPPDGFSPRMQMYLWRYGYFLTYNAPSDLVGRRPEAGYNSGFGGAFPVDNPLTGDVVMATPADACTSLTNSNLTGKIALIQRGNCNFDVKFKKAQDSGAKAVIIYNPDPSQSIINMSGQDNTVKIPGILINNAEGEIIKNKIGQNINVNVNLKYSTFDLDGSLDNGVIAHEYTHGISTRSTGNGYSCLNVAYANEQMGEGWSDFMALMVTGTPDATSATPRSTGSFVANQSATGSGIRPAKYSPDFSVNDYTYGDTNGKFLDTGDGTLIVDVHAVGFIWATMLWDLHWKFADKYGYSNDIANHPNSGSGKVVQLVMEAMKIQGCYPNFISGRDAIIAADADLNNGENKCMIWSAFAKRGLGANASAGATRGTLPNAISDQVEDYSLPAECSLGTSDVAVSKKVSIYPNPARKEVYIKTNGAHLTGKVKITIYDLSGKKLDEQLINSEDPIITSGLSKGVYILTGEGIGVSFSNKLMID